MMPPTACRRRIMKYRRLISALVIAPTLFLVTGCTSIRAVSPEDLRPPGTAGSAAGEKVQGVVTKSGQDVQFDEPVRPVTGWLYATVDGEPYEISLDQVDRVTVRREDNAKTLGLVAFVVGFTAFTVALTLMIAGSMYGSQGCCTAN
jgi:hypothetical protein